MFYLIHDHLCGIVISRKSIMNVYLAVSCLRHSVLRLTGICRLSALGVGKLALLLLLNTLALNSYAVPPACYEDWSPNPFYMPSSIPIPRDANLPVGSLLGPPVTQSYSFHCDGNPAAPSFPVGDHIVRIQFKTLNPGIWKVRSGGGLITPTSVPGVGLLMNNWTNITQTSGNEFATAWGLASFGGYVTMQFIKTGPITPGVIKPLPDLFHFDWGINGSNSGAGFSNQNKWFSVNGGTSIYQSGCAVTAGSVNLNVNLPTVAHTKFSGVGSTTGDTPFNLSLSCNSGSTVKITMDTTSSTIPGVIQPTVGAGFTTGIGVQILDKAKNPVNFSTKTTVGASPDGILNIPYTARYYQTSSPISGGKVSATITYTMAYE